MERLDGRSSWQVEANANALLAQDIDLTKPELRLLGSKGEKRLYGIIGYGTDLRIDSIAGDLPGTSMVSCCHVCTKVGHSSHGPQQTTLG